MTILLDFIKNLIDSGSWLVPVVFLPAVLLWKSRAIFQFFVHVRSHRKQLLLDSLKIKDLSSTTRDAVIEEIERIVYYQATRMVRGRAQRESIKRLCDQSHGKLEIDDFRKASRNLPFKHGLFVPDLGRLSTVVMVISLLFSIFLFMCGAVLIASGVIDKWGALQTALLIALGFLYTMIAGLMISQAMPYWAAKRIRPILDDLQQDGSIRTQVPSLPFQTNREAIDGEQNLQTKPVGNRIKKAKDAVLPKDEPATGQIPCSRPTESGETR